MNKQQLYSMLDIETPADFEYFEQFADLIECPENIPYELFCEVLSQIRPEDAGELAEHYLEEITDALPSNGDDLVSVLSSIQDRLMLLAEDLDREENRRSFAEELYKFREWYTEPFGVSVDGNPASLLDAITTARMEKLGHPEHAYDFSNRMNYELDELSMDLGSFSPIDMKAAMTDEEQPE